VGADFVTVRKGRGRVHLAVGLAPGETVETLCDKRFEAGAVEASDLDVDCQSCLRRQNDPGRVSSAFFEGGRGSALLELSLQQARERRTAVPSPIEAEPNPPAPRRVPHLTVVPSQRSEQTERRAAAAPPGTAPAARPVSDPRPAEPEPAGLPPGFYRTPAGVLLRVGGHAERPRLERRSGNRVRIVAGDVEVDVPPG